MSATKRVGRVVLTVFIIVVFCREMSVFVSTSSGLSDPSNRFLFSAPVLVEAPLASPCSYGHNWDFLNCLVNAHNGRASSLTIYGRPTDDDLERSTRWIHGFLPQTTLRVVTNTTRVLNEGQLDVAKPLVSDGVLLHVENVNDLNQLLSPDIPKSIVSSRLFSLIPAYTTNLTILIGTQPTVNNDISLSTIREAFPLAKVNMVSRDEDQKSRHYLGSFPINLGEASLLICYEPESLFCALSALLLGEDLRSTISLKQQTSSLDWLIHSNPPLLLPNLVVIDHKQHSPTVDMRSRIGSWSYDAAYGKQHFYQIKSRDRIWNIKDQFENQSMPTTYGSQKWKSFDDEDASLEFVNLLGFCQSMHDFGEKIRFLVIGDSLQYMHMISFLYSIGIPRSKMSIQHHLFPRKRMRALQFIACPNGLPDIELIFYRTNHAMPLSSISKRLFRHPSTASSSLYTKHTKSTPEKEARILNKRTTFMKDQLPKRYGTKRHLQEYYRCYGALAEEFPDKNGFCPWHNEYRTPRKDCKYSETPNTLIYIGIGAHFHHEKAFAESMTHFMRFVEDEVQSEDAIWFRTATPGHEGCGSSVENATFGEPYNSFQEYLKYGQTDMYDWNKFQYYNRIFESTVWDHQRKRSNVTLPDLALTDVYWMTALRKDGHGSSIDCLHYLMPGAPDWWSHVFYSQLKEAAAAYKDNNQSL